MASRHTDQQTSAVSSAFGLFQHDHFGQTSHGDDAILVSFQIQQAHALGIAADFSDVIHLAPEDFALAAISMISSSSRT